MVTKVYCDRCGKLICEERRIGVMRVEVLQRYYEVCDECAEAIRDFITGESENGNTKERNKVSEKHKTST